VIASSEIFYIKKQLFLILNKGYGSMEVHV